MFVRYRFFLLADDPRPVQWPLPAGSAYWISGENADGEPVLVAWLPKGQSVLDFWPEASGIEELGEANLPEFTGRFSMPAYWVDPSRPLVPRRFQVIRKDDSIGITGTGIICTGVEWPDGSATTKYRQPVSSETSWPDGLAALEKTLLNPKVGNTELVWLDPEPVKE